MPEFARHQNDPAQTRERYLSLVSAASAVGVSVMAIVFVCAPPLMDLVGPEWSESALVLQVLCAVGVVRVITMVNGPAVVGAGHPGAQAALMWASAGLSAAAFVGAGVVLSDRGLHAQVVGMAASRAVLYVVILLPLSQAWLIKRYVGVRSLEFGRAVGPPVAVSVAAAAAGTLVVRLMTGLEWPSAVVLVMAGLTTALLVVPANLAVSPPARRIATRLVGRVL